MKVKKQKYLAFAHLHRCLSIEPTEKPFSATREEIETLYKDLCLLGQYPDDFFLGTVVIARKVVEEGYHRMMLLRLFMWALLRRMREVIQPLPDKNEPPLKSLEKIQISEKIPWLEARLHEHKLVLDNSFEDEQQIYVSEVWSKAYGPNDCLVEDEAPLIRTVEIFRACLEKSTAHDLVGLAEGLKSIIIIELSLYANNVHEDPQRVIDRLYELKDPQDDLARVALYLTRGKTDIQSMQLLEDWKDLCATFQERSDITNFIKDCFVLENARYPNNNDESYSYVRKYVPDVYSRKEFIERLKHYRESMAILSAEEQDELITLQARDAMPLFMFLASAHMHGRIDSLEHAQIVHLLKTYLVRRHFGSGFKGAQLGLFVSGVLTLLKDHHFSEKEVASKAPVAHASESWLSLLKHYLSKSKGSLRMPSNAEFAESLSVYNFVRKDEAFYVLSHIAAHESRLNIQNFTSQQHQVIYIMPPQADELHCLFSRIGNLALVLRDPIDDVKVDSTMTFQEKQPYLKQVRWKRMHKIADLHQWDVLSMHDNARAFIRIALHVWPHPEGNIEAPEEE